MKYLLYLSTFIFFTISPIHAIDGLKLKQLNEQEIKINQSSFTGIDFHDSEEVNNSSPGLFFFLIFGLMFIVVFVGVGITLTAATLFLIFGFISAGILSTSVLIALNRKSFSKGFRSFVALTTTLSGLIIGSVVFWILNLITHWWDYKIALLTGSISGLTAGILVGFLVFYVTRKITTNLRARLKLNLRNK
jgi:hypothetical protein